MLKLTRNDLNSLYIAAKHIVAMEQYSDGDKTSILTTSGSHHVVVETIEQIMAMPEMLYEAYPAIVVSGKDLNDQRFDVSGTGQRIPGVR